MNPTYKQLEAKLAEALKNSHSLKMACEVEEARSKELGEDVILWKNQCAHWKGEAMKLAQQISGLEGDLKQARQEASDARW